MSRADHVLHFVASSCNWQHCQDVRNRFLLQSEPCKVLSRKLISFSDMASLCHP